MPAAPGAVTVATGVPPTPAPMPFQAALHRCTACDDVIGIYEPMVVVDAGIARSTSFAADHGRAPSATAARYHESCYQAATGTPAA